MKWLGSSWSRFFQQVDCIFPLQIDAARQKWGCWHQYKTPQDREQRSKKVHRRRGRITYNVFRELFSRQIFYILMLRVDNFGKLLTLDHFFKYPHPYSGIEFFGVSFGCLSYNSSNGGSPENSVFQRRILRRQTSFQIQQLLPSLEPWCCWIGEIWTPPVITKTIFDQIRKRRRNETYTCG